MPSIQINNATLTFNNIYYVDPVNGVDTNSGTSASPYRTLSKAVTSCASTGDAIYAMSGTHDVTTQFGTGTVGTGTCGVQDSGKLISFIGNKLNTIFSVRGTDQSTTPRDVHCISTTGGSKFYDILFNYDTGTRTNAYSCSIFGSNSTTVKGEMYNCVVNHTGSVSCSFMYDNGSFSAVKVVNSVVKTIANMQANYAGATSTTLTVLNTACNYTISIGSGTQSSNLSNVTLNAYYKITSSGYVGTGTTSTYNGVTPTVNPDGSANDIGAYGGVYALGDWTPRKILFQFATSGNYRKYNTSTSTWDIVSVSSTPTESDFNTYGVDSSVVNGYSYSVWDSAKSIDSNITVHAYTGTQAYVPAFEVHKKSIPTTQPIIMSNVIALSAISNVDFVTITSNIAGGGAVYVLMSPEGTNWYTFSGGTFTQVLLSTIATNGVSPSVINGMTSANWETFRALIQPNGATMIKFAFGLSMNSTTDTANIDQISVQADMNGKWNRVKDTDVDYAYYNDYLEVTFLTAGDYKINY